MYILHLSDLHFGSIDQAENWHGQLMDDLYQLLPQLENSQAKQLSALIISGDVANYSTPKEYEAAAQFINRLASSCGLKQQQIVIVPGNHDLNWDLSEDAYDVVPYRKYENSRQAEDIAENSPIVDGNYVLIPKPGQCEQRFQYFSEFYKKVTSIAYPQQYKQQYNLQHFSEKNLLVLGLNSAWELNHHNTSSASINSNALNSALEKINNNPTYKNSRLKIVVWHHPLNGPDEDRIKDHGFMERLAVNGFQVALHGHIHKARAEYYKYSEGSKIDIIAAGTFGAPRRQWVPGYPLQYNLLEWQDNKLIVNTRKRTELGGAWKPDSMWQVDGKTNNAYYQINLGEEDENKLKVDKPIKTGETLKDNGSSDSTSGKGFETGGKDKTITSIQSEQTLDILSQLEKHYDLVIKAIKDRRIVFFLGAGVNLCSREEIAEWVPSCNYPPTNKELASYLAQTYGCFPYEAIELVCPDERCNARQEYGQCTVPDDCLFRPESLEEKLEEQCILIQKSCPQLMRIDLQHLSQHADFEAGQEGLSDELHKVFITDYQPNQLHKFFANLSTILRKKGDAPFYPLIVTTNYDDTLEIAFKQAQEPYDLVSYSAKGQRDDCFVHVTPEGTIKIDKPNEYLGLLQERTVILKLYGALAQNEHDDQFIITEEDYIDYFAWKAVNEMIPASLLSPLLRSHILFLGYSLRDWNQRIVLHHLWDNLTSANKRKWWSIQPGPGNLDRKLLARYSVELIDLFLDDYICGLNQRLERF